VHPFSSESRCRFSVLRQATEGWGRIAFAV
jgi:hypothetical protein